MNKYCRELLVIQCLLLSGYIMVAQERALWMKGAKRGIMVHYLADWIARTENRTMDPAIWNELVNHFDVEGLAEQIKTAGAGYLIFTIGQNSGYYVAPNKAYDQYTGEGSKCSKRDLIADLSAALKKRGLKLIVYLPSGAPAGDSLARVQLEWKNGPYPNKEFQQKWEAIIREWSLRWGKKIDGWWFDGCYWPNIMYRNEQAPNFTSFAAAARAGNAASVVAFNVGVTYRTISVTPQEDYTAGEIDKPELISIRRSYDGKVDGSQVQVLSYLGTRWGTGEPRFTNDQIINFTQQVNDLGGAITWDVPVQSNGLIATKFMEQLQALK